MHCSRSARSAYAYRELKREDFLAVVEMLADGFTTHRGPA